MVLSPMWRWPVRQQNYPVGFLGSFSLLPFFCCQKKVKNKEITPAASALRDSKAINLDFWAAFLWYFAFGELANGENQFSELLFDHLLGSFSAKRKYSITVYRQFYPGCQKIIAINRTINYIHNELFVRKPLNTTCVNSKI